MTSLAPAVPGFPLLKQAEYRLRLAQDAEDLRRIQRLRFEVFNLELGEGLQGSYATGLDQDRFDAQAHHLLVEHGPSGSTVGTYRLQTLAQAKTGGGFYTSTEYDLGPLEPLLPWAAEASRACVRRDHRDGPAIRLLWKGIARYLVARGCRYLFGVTSLTSQSPQEGLRGWVTLRDRGSLHKTLRLDPLPAFACAPAAQVEDCTLPPLRKMPPLFDAYLRLGTRILGYPARDRAFGTIDYLALLDLDRLPPLARRHFMP